MPRRAAGGGGWVFDSGTPVEIWELAPALASFAHAHGAEALQELGLARAALGGDTARVHAALAADEPWVVLKLLPALETLLRSRADVVQLLSDARAAAAAATAAVPTALLRPLELAAYVVTESARACSYILS